MKQEEHHRAKTFKEEYLKMLNDFDVAYEDKYLFEFYDWKKYRPDGTPAKICFLLPK